MIIVIPTTKLENRILRGLASGAMFDFTVRNIARSFQLNERRIRRVMKRLQKLGLVEQELQAKEGNVSHPAIWSAV